MPIPKTVVSRIFLIGEIVLFIAYCLFDSSALPQYIKLKNAFRLISFDIQELECQILELESDINKWNIDPFYKEKKVREQLQMAQPNEEIIFIKTIKGVS